MESHAFYDQVCLDVARSLKRFPPSIEEGQRIEYQDQLIVLIMRVLINNPSLHYYQGYHDICLTFLMILGEEAAFQVVNAISLSHLKEFMEKTMEKTSAILEIIPLILKEEDPDFYQFLKQSRAGTIYSLSWVITWYSHILRRYKNVGRLFDFFLSSHRLMPVYLAASFVLHKRTQALELDCDMPSVFQFLTRFIEHEEDTLPIEQLIEKSIQLMNKYDPDEMVKMGVKRHHQLKPRPRNTDIFPIRLVKQVCWIIRQRPWILATGIGLAAYIVYQHYMDPEKTEYLEYSRSTQYNESIEYES